MVEKTSHSDSPTPRQGPKRGRKPRVAPRSAQLGGKKYLRILEDHVQALRAHYPHPNRILFMDDVVTAYLLAFFNPTLRSLRCLEDASELPAINQFLSVESVCKSTLSDANALFDPDLLLPLVRRLREAHACDVPLDKDLEAIYRQIILFDGSFFDVAADVAWAIRTTHAGSTTAQVRLNLQFALANGLPQGISVSGAADGGESDAALELELAPGQIVIADRGVFSFRLLSGLQAKSCHALLRVKNNIGFDRAAERPLTPDDREHRVLSDHAGGFSSQAGASPAPSGVWREIIVAHQSDPDQTVRIITDLLELPAWQIAELYRLRWQIEICQPYCLQSKRFYELPFRRLGTVRSAA